MVKETGSSHKPQSQYFNLMDYDCIGFDLDNTICKYKLGHFLPHIYDGLGKFLVDKKGYSAELLKKPFHKSMDFMHKGLLLDIERGNFMKISKFGKILKATHGTKPLTQDEIKLIYGPDCTWLPVVDFKKKMTEGRGKMSKLIRSFKDYFDLPAAVISAHIVDIQDMDSIEKIQTYTFWPDVLEGLIDMYHVGAFRDDTGNYFPGIKQDISKFVYPCSPEIREWLKQLSEKKTLFLLTGSHVDYASFLSEYCLGEDWRKYFKIVVTNGRKPGFFSGSHSFLHLNGIKEDEPISGNELKENGIYSQGNWKDLYGFIRTLTGKSDPSVVYFGDNLIQDVFAPATYTQCDAVAVVEEMEAEQMEGSDKMHPQSAELVSEMWGSFFYEKENEDTSISQGAYQQINTLWADVICSYSKICIPSFDCLAELPIDYRHETFANGCCAGFVPGPPKVLLKK